MKKYHGPHTGMWDGWTVVAPDGRLHLFHLQMPGPDCPLPEEEAWAIGHAVSEDGLHWEWLGSILPPLKDDAFPMDYHSKFTGCAVEKDGRCYLFYTMRDKAAGNQRIGVALSEDWIHFVPWEGNPVLEPDDSILLGYSSVSRYEWGNIDCRDMLILREEESGRYLGYFAAAADVGRSHPGGVIAMAESDDLLHWDSQRIVFVPRQNGVLEVPDVFQLDGKWVLTFLSGANYAGLSLAADEGVQNGTFYALSDSPRGPFVEKEDNLLLGGIVRSGTSCRSIVWKDQRLVYYTDRAYGGETYSLPKALRLDEEGRLRAVYTPMLKKLRLREFPPPEGLTPIPNSFAWRTYGGESRRTEAGYLVTTTSLDYQVFMAPVGVAALEWKGAVTVDAVGGGLYFSDGVHKYLLSIQPDKQRLRVTTLYDFSYLASRLYPFRQHTSYDLRVLIMEGVLEVYVQEELLLQCELNLDGVAEWGIFSDRGETLVEDLELYELE